MVCLLCSPSQSVVCLLSHIRCFQSVSQLFFSGTKKFYPGFPAFSTPGLDPWRKNLKGSFKRKIFQRWLF